MRFASLAGAVLVAAVSSAHAQSSTRAADPTSLSLALARAAPGDTVRLAAGYYEDIVLPVRDHRPAVVIDASAATVRSLTIRGTAGWAWRGGRIVSPLPPKVWRNVMIDNARRIEVSGTVLTGGHTGVVVTRGSEDIVLRANHATGLQSDGFNIATARRVSLIDNQCTDFRPIPAIFNAKGKMLKDGTHPDCIMMWSEKGQTPTSDLTITGNRMSGKMQGITHFWHPSLGRGPVRNVKVLNNIVDVSWWHGINMDNTIGLTVRGNRVSSIAGARSPAFPFSPIRTWLKFEGTGIVACGNSVEDFPTGPGTKPC